MNSERHAKQADMAIYGPYPPPYGGISVHVKRLCPLLDAAGITWRVYNAVGDFEVIPEIVNVTRRKARAGLASLLYSRHKAFYVLSTRSLPRLWAGLLARRRRRVILHIDGASFHDAIHYGGWWERHENLFAVRNVWGVIGVNRSITELAAEIRGSKDRVWCIPAYLAPADGDGNSVDDGICAFTQCHRPTMLAMGRVSRDRWGADVYGVELLIKLLARLQDGGWEKAGLVFVLRSPEDSEGEELLALRRMIERLGLADHVLIHCADGELVPMMDRCDLMVRPTSTDGDSVAVREALSRCLPVVASDCVVRPEGAILHRTGDLTDLTIRVSEAIRARREIAASLRRLVPDDHWPQLRCVFEEALNTADSQPERECRR